MKSNLAELEQKLGYKFNNSRLLQEALCHKSYVNESYPGTKSYERLEFLGDSVLGVVVSRYIYDNYTSFPEGELTKLRASVVCERTLSQVARSLDIGRFILLSKGELQSGGADKDAILCDVFEAIIAAIYIDGNMESAASFVMNNLCDVIKCQAEAGSDINDYKTALQELVQQKGGTVEYKIVAETGPDHAKQYEAEVCAFGKSIARGVGASKKKAQQDAAKKAVAIMQN